MKVKTKFLGLEAGGKSVVVLNREDAEDIGVSSLSRVRVRSKGRELAAIINTATRTIEKGTIGVYDEVKNSLNLKRGEVINVEAVSVSLFRLFDKK